MLCREHRLIARQFIDFKTDTYTKMDKMDFYYKDLIRAEQRLVLKNPVLEAEYILNSDSPLKLYDCLIPRMKEYLVSRPKYKKEHNMQSYSAQLDMENKYIVENTKLMIEN